jgi:FMN phosphatase YigB (HAD superfamily)
MRDVGLVTMTDVLESEFNIKSQVIIDQLLDVWNHQVVKFDLEVLDFWSDKDLYIALLSNVGTDHSIMIDKFFNSLPENNPFNRAIRYYSCNVGVRKPQSLYYQSFLEQHPEFRGCIYLDDLPENLEAASKFGFLSTEFNLEKITNIKTCLKAIETMICETEEEKNSRWH